MNIYCPNCVNECSEAATACPKCGHPLRATAKTATIFSRLTRRRPRLVVLAGFGLALVAIFGGLWKTIGFGAFVPAECVEYGLGVDGFEGLVSFHRRIRAEYGWTRSHARLFARTLCEARCLDNEGTSKAYSTSWCLQCEIHAINEVYDDLPPLPITWSIPPKPSPSEACAGGKEKLAEWFTAVREENKQAGMSKIEAKQYWREAVFAGFPKGLGVYDASEEELLVHQMAWECWVAIVDQVYGE